MKRLMQIGWSDIGMSETPGEFDTSFGIVEVTPDNIAVWKEQPTAVFTLLPHVSINPPRRLFRLGIYSVQPKGRAEPEGDNLHLEAKHLTTRLRFEEIRVGLRRAIAALNAGDTREVERLLLVLSKLVDMALEEKRGSGKPK